MGLNKKSLSVSKTNIGLGNVANLSPADLLKLLGDADIRYKLPDPPTDEGQYVLRATVDSQAKLTLDWVPYPIEWEDVVDE